MVELAKKKSTTHKNVIVMLRKEYFFYVRKGGTVPNRYNPDFTVCMILMCRTSTHKNNMGAFVVRTLLGLVKIIQNLYDD